MDRETNQKLAGRLILFMAPSGSGKSVLLRYVKDQLPELHFAVSCTTRDMRPGEVDGQVYHFLTPEEFQARIDQGDFLEWAEYGGNRYGTLKSEILEPMRQGKVVLREVELQGVQSIMELIPPEKRVIIYIDGGDWETLKARILARAPISDEQLALRHERYVKETEAKPLADIVIKNEDGQLERTQQELMTVLEQIINSTTRSQ